MEKPPKIAIVKVAGGQGRAFAADEAEKVVAYLALFGIDAKTESYEWGFSPDIAPVRKRGRPKKAVAESAPVTTIAAGAPPAGESAEDLLAIPENLRRTAET